MIDQSRLKKQMPTSQRVKQIQANYYALIDYLEQLGAKETELICYAHWHLFPVVEKALKPIMRKDKRLLKVVPDFPTMVFAEVNLDTPEKVKDALRTLYNQKIQPFYRHKRKLVYQVIRDFIEKLAEDNPEVARWVELFGIWYRNKYQKTHVGADEIVYMRPLHWSKLLAKKEEKP